MKFDKESIIVIAVCIILIGAWSYFFPHQTEEPVQTAEVQQTVEPAQPTVQQAAVQKSVEPIKTLIPPKKKTVKTRAFSLSNGFVEYVFNSEVVLNEIVLKDVRRSQSNQDPLIIREPAGFEPMSAEIPGCTLHLKSVKKLNDSVLLAERIGVFADGRQFLMTQTFAIDTKSSLLKCSVSLKPVGSGIVLPSVILWSGSLAPLKEMSDDEVMRDVHQIEYSLAGSHKVVTGDPAAKSEKFLKKQTSDSLEWVAVSNKYFLSLLSTNLPFNGGCELRHEKIAGNDSEYALPKIGGVYNNVTLPAEYNLQFYSGLKDMKRMSALPESAFGVIHLAYWGWLEPICRPMLWMLNLLKDLTGSYGLAIILLTVIVKLVLWPLIHRGNKSMRKMQKLQPKLKELKEKYKDNQQEFSAKMTELYRQEKVNPLGGCLPMLLQIPIFIALYSTLDSAVELRHVPFLWAADLSRPDLVGPPLLFGIGIHPLIVISTLLTVLQMKLTPSTGDSAQQKMMMIMPVMMLFFFYNFPSGLALYWTVNNILSILQMKYSQYSAAKEEAAEAAAK